MKVTETDRLVLRWLEPDDAPFILELVNQPSWLRFIGDRGVRTLDDARAYIANGPLDMCRRLGFGLFAVELKASGGAIGLCGLLKRDVLPDVDLGFAFLPAHWGQGYANESANAVVAFAESTLGLERIVAITSPDNQASIRLLRKLGFGLERMVRLSDEGSDLELYARQRISTSTRCGSA